MNETKKKCPRCGFHTGQKLITGGKHVIYKGKGFYSKDNMRGEK